MPGAPRSPGNSPGNSPVSWLGRAAARVRALFHTPHPADATTRELGALGERAAERLLTSGGYTILGRNLRVPMGEADLLCRAPDRKTVVIVEVKTRLRRPDAPVLSNTTAPEASITARKRRKLITIARHLTKANAWDPSFVRIDVVGVEFDAVGASPTLRHHESAVRTR